MCLAPLLDASEACTPGPSFTLDAQAAFTVHRLHSDVHAYPVRVTEPAVAEMAIWINTVNSSCLFESSGLATLLPSHSHSPSLLP